MGYHKDIHLPRDIKYFESKFECKIEDSREYKQYVRVPQYIDWDGRAPFKAELDIIPMKAIHLTTDNLARLVAEQERMDRWQDEAEYAKKVLKMLREDERVRDENPAVAKAYRNYLTLLELARK